MAASSTGGSISPICESSMLVDWELDTVKTEQDETVARSLINYRHLKTELRSQCEKLSAQQEALDEDEETHGRTEDQTLTVWVMGSWGALESVDGKSEEAKEYSKRKAGLTKKILMLKIQVVCLKLVRVSSCIRQLQVCDQPSSLLLFSRFLLAKRGPFIDPGIASFVRFMRL